MNAWSRVRVVLCVVLAVTGSMVGGCRRQAAVPYQRGERRVVSLSPAVTQMLLDLHRGQWLVGVTSGDPAAPADLPRLGRYPAEDALDYERLVQLQPTDIFIQPGQAGLPARLGELAGRYGWRLHVFKFETVRDVLDGLYDPSVTDQSRCVGGALGIPVAAGILAAEIQEDLERLAEAVAEQDRPDVLLLHSVEPLSGAGPQTFLGELLRYAGGRNVLSSRSGPYPLLDKETVIALKPQVIVVLGAAPPGGGVPTSLAGLPVPAVEQGRVEYLEDRLAMLPSSSMPRVAVALARRLHRSLGPRLDAIAFHYEKR